MTLLATVIGRGTTAAKPAATDVPVGSLYFDTTLEKMQRSSGSAWEDCAETASAAGAMVYGVCGRLTLESGVPVSTSDQTAKTTVYFTPYNGNQIGFADGTVLTFAEASVAVPATTNTPFDIFAYDNSGTIALETVNWTNDTTRATALAWSNGCLVKNGDTTRLYLGTGRTTGSSGQTADALLTRYLWNYYNRVWKKAHFSDGTSTHTYINGGATWRQYNNSSASQVAFVIGVSEDHVITAVGGYLGQGTNGKMASLSGALDATNAEDDEIGTVHRMVTTAATDATMAYSAGTKLPGIGYHYLALIERGDTSSTATIGYGKITATIRG